MEGIFLLILSVLFVLLIMYLPHCRKIVWGSRTDWGITFFGWLIILMNGFGIFVTFFYWEEYQVELSTYPPLLQIVALISIIMWFIFFLFGFSVLSLKESVRKPLLILIILYLANNLLGYIVYSTSYKPVTIGEWIEAVLDTVLAGIIYWYFSKNEIKQQFH